MAEDASTTLNPGVGGDALDETSVVQADGATSVKRARVDVGFAADDDRGRLVGKDTPLPVDAGGSALERMASDIAEIKNLLKMLL